MALLKLFKCLNFDFLNFQKSAYYPSCTLGLEAKCPVGHLLEEVVEAGAIKLLQKKKRRGGESGCKDPEEFWKKFGFSASHLLPS